MEPREPVLAPLALAGLSAVVAVSLARVFTGTSFLLPALAAALLPHVVGLVSRRGRWPVAANALLSILSLVLVAAWTVGHRTLVYGVPTLATLQRIRPDLHSGWMLFRTAVAPVRPTDGALLLGIIALWAIAQIADELAFRMQRALAAVIPSLTLFAIVAVIGTAEYRVGLTVAFAAVAIAYLHVVNRAGLLDRAAAAGSGAGAPGAGSGRTAALPGTNTAPARGARRELRAGAVIGALAIGLGTVAGAFVPGVSGSALVKYNGLNSRGRGVGDVTVSNPIVGFGDKLRTPSPVEVFTVRAKQPLYWRLAGLDRFNGNQWTFADTQSPAAEGLRNPAAGSTTMHQEYHVTGLTGFLVPAGFVPVKTSLGGAVIAPRTLTIVAAETLSGSTYTIDSQVPHTPTRAEKAATTAPATDPRIRDDLALPGDFPASVRRTAHELTDGQSNAWDKSQALENYFTGGAFTYDLKPALDDSSRAIAEFLRDRHGFCQQFAAAFAAMARSVGIPARVAVGFTYGTRIGPDTYQVTNQQLHAWPEVWLSGLGWTAFEPTPKGDAPGQTPNSPGAQTGEAPAGTQAPATTAATNRPGAPATTAVAPTTLGSKPADDPTPAWVWAVAAIPVALAIGAAAFAIAVTAAKRRRERRRRARPDTRDAVAGAWAEAVDRLQESGRVVRPDLTPLELAGDASTREPEQLSGLLLVLARSYTAASCSPRRPEPEAVTEAWGAVDELGRYLERSVGPAVRWRHRLDPRTIWRRRARHPTG
jgi:transglutaminase-like putative cysteine protease